MAITTLGNVKAAFDIDGTSDDERINSLITQVGEFVETYTGRDLTAISTNIYPESNGGTVLVLPDFPVAALTTIHESTDLPRVYDASTLLTPDEDYIVILDRGIVHRVDGRPWSREIKAIKVALSKGFLTVPAALERAAIEIIGVKLQKGKAKIYHLTGEDRGDGNITGIRFVDIPDDTLRVLDLYRDEARI